MNSTPIEPLKNKRSSLVKILFTCTLTAYTILSTMMWLFLYTHTTFSRVMKSMIEWYSF